VREQAAKAFAVVVGLNRSAAPESLRSQYCPTDVFPAVHVLGVHPSCRRFRLLPSMGSVGDCYDCEDPLVGVRPGGISTVVALGVLTLAKTGLVFLR